MKNTKIIFILLVLAFGALLQGQDRVRRSRTDGSSDTANTPTVGVDISFDLPNLLSDNAGIDGGLLLSEQGTIVLSHVSFTRRPDSFESLNIIQAVSADGQLLWETNLDAYKNQLIVGRALSGDRLLLVLQEQSSIYLVGDSDLAQLAGFDPLAYAAGFTSTLICLDLSDGSQKWSADWQGNVHSLQTAGDSGWLLRYSRVEGDQIEKRLASVHFSGTVNWDLTTLSKPFALGGR